MKSIIKTIVITSVVLSTNVFAESAIERLNVETIKQELTPAQIELTLKQWKTEELINLEQKAQAISDRAPIEARRELVKQQIDQEYKQALITFGL
ncbi:conserved exported hypothetical protein [Vibrio crassostreae]|uniref:hypothetical protein n=1 Tax=Vibrio crassostreae TaxID=246167 RepID=UPI001B31575B|nr:hypothetical protein [Vibrio crassostreae]CAK1933045.1 conserved exported hypothetical protein [Vibrio crassostreae]CAK1938602.1 conserved exported hypothetical protein [Vibrio crassostreae]CAK1950818.1 conserved exported hypothetical protein [Vibrio crassostreae]CAK1951778.1 conserved exported hypothetical protein [Vibrio crassostreae]CAK1958175.1 conserved exported hypothetical protein [Vibrio crassostreae]